MAQAVSELAKTRLKSVRSSTGWKLETEIDRIQSQKATQHCGVADPPDRAYGADSPAPLSFPASDGRQQSRSYHGGSAPLSAIIRRPRPLTRSRKAVPYQEFAIDGGQREPVSDHRAERAEGAQKPAPVFIDDQGHLAAAMNSHAQKRAGRLDPSYKGVRVTASAMGAVSPNHSRSSIAKERLRQPAKDSARRPEQAGPSGPRPGAGACRTDHISGLAQRATQRKQATGRLATPMVRAQPLSLADIRP